MLRLRFQSMRRYAALLGSFATVVALLTPISAQQRVVDVICGTGLTAADAPRAVDGDALFARQTPAILTADYTGRVELEIVSLGTIRALRVFYFRGSSYAFDEFSRVQGGVLAGQAISVFRPSWTMSDFVLRFGLAIDYE
jgi:hypothetical protein